MERGHSNGFLVVNSPIAILDLVPRHHLDRRNSESEEVVKVEEEARLSSSVSSSVSKTSLAEIESCG
jgi:hypothetical protein